MPNGILEHVLVVSIAFSLEHTAETFLYGRHDDKGEEGSLR